jgi:transglutaminase-like putative cysteine protease
VTRYRIVHETRYAYGAPVSLGHHLAHLAPVDLAQQTCLGTELEVVPTPAVYREWVDFFGNRAAYFSVETPHDALTVRALSEVEVRAPRRRGAAGGSPPWETVREEVQAARRPHASKVRPFALESPLVPLGEEVAAYAGPAFAPGRPVLEAVADLMGRIHREFAYDPTFTTVSTPLADVLTHRRGVCQDFAHLAIACLRAQGLAAAYISGYLETDPAPGQERLVGADASHAWFSVWVPDLGWVDFDPTNDVLPMERHVTVARGRDYADVAPLRGVLYGGGVHSLSVAVTVERVA